MHEKFIKNIESILINTLGAKVMWMFLMIFRMLFNLGTAQHCEFSFLSLSSCIEYSYLKVKKGEI